MGKASRKETRDPHLRRPDYRLDEPLTREELNEFIGYLPSMIFKTLVFVFWKVPYALLIATIVVVILMQLTGVN